MKAVPVTKGSFSSGTPVTLFQSSIRPIQGDWFQIRRCARWQSGFILVSLRRVGNNVVARADHLASAREVDTGVGRRAETWKLKVCSGGSDV
jgi:hypothetical protein